MRSFLCAGALAAAILPALGGSSTAQPPIVDGVSIRLQPLADLNTAVNWGTHAGDGSGRFFVETQSGVVRLFKNGGLIGAPFLDIPSVLSIQAGGEKGLLGMAFHPGFGAAAGTPGSGKLYTYTSEARAGTPDFTHPELGDTGGDHHSVVREWTVSAANPDRIDTAIPSRVVMRITEPQSNHNGGGLVFDAGGSLYIALGDGGGGNDNNGGINSATDGHTNGTGNAQDINNVYGKILRINPLASGGNKYTVPAANPFTGVDAEGVAVPGVDEIFAYGLRNPFRISFDRGSGLLYAGDVGQGAREEVDIVSAGGNYGWVYMEGTRVNRAGGPAGMLGPIAEYTHNDGFAIIGGFVYRGTAMPGLVGKYVFGDLNGRLFYTNANGGPIREFGIAGGAVAGGLNGFGEDQQGEIFALYDGGDIVALTRSVAQWGVNAAGNWSVAGNWTGGVPNAAGVLASFGAVITAPRTVTVNAPQTVGAIVFDNANAYTLAGPATLTIDADGPATIEVAGGSHTIGAPLAVAAGTSLAKTGPGTLTVSGPQSHAAGTVWTVAAGTLNLNSDGGPNLSLLVNATTNLGVSQHLAELSVGAGGVARLTLGGGKVVSTPQLHIDAAGILDLADNDLIVRAVPGTQQAELAAVGALVASGRAGAAWNGPGIHSSAAASDPNTLTALGVMLNDNGAGGPFYTQFSGEPVDSSSVLVKYTYYGDANLSGSVDGTDYALIDNGFNAGLAGWLNGDFDYSGAIDGTDYALIDNAFNSQGGPLGIPAVPEPAGGLLLALGLAGTLLARRHVARRRPA